MSKTLLGTICGVIYGALSTASMIPLTFSDKKAAKAPFSYGFIAHVDAAHG
jgi:hypothetical protein